MHYPSSPPPSPQSSSLTLTDQYQASDAALTNSPHPNSEHQPHDTPPIKIHDFADLHHHNSPTPSTTSPTIVKRKPAPVPHPPSPPPQTSFRIRRGNVWVDPGAPPPPPFTPAGPIPPSRDAYTSWLHRHHAMTMLSTRELQQGDAQPASTNHPTASRTDTPGRPRRWAPPSWMPWRGRGTGEGEAANATFRVWEPYSVWEPHSHSQPQTPTAAADRTDTGAGEGQGERFGRWVSYPSVLVTEGPVDAEEARYRARVAAGFTKTPRNCGGRKCQPGPLPRWMVATILVGMPLILAVGVGVLVVDTGKGWCKERREKKREKRARKDEEEAARWKVEEEAARWKVEGWDGEEA